MSTRVYLSNYTCQTTPKEDTPVCLRIQLSRTTVKDLHSRLQHAYQRDDVRLVRRITVLLDLLVHHVPVAVLCERWGLSPACIYGWQKAFLLRGLDSLVYGHGGGRRPKLSPNTTVVLMKRRAVCSANTWRSLDASGAMWTSPESVRRAAASPARRQKRQRISRTLSGTPARARS